MNIQELIGPAFHRSLVLESFERRRKTALRKAKAKHAGEADGLLDFVEYCKPDYRAGWFHRELCVIVQEFLAMAIAGERPRFMISAPPQHGKPLYTGTMVLLQDGSRRPLGDIRVGDRVITGAARAKRVLRVFEQGLLPCVRITTEYGREATPALDHPFLTPAGWVNAGDLKVGMTLGCVPEAQTRPTAKETIDEFRMAGYFLGDGQCGPSKGSCACNITSHDKEIADDITSTAEALLWDWHWSKPGRLDFSNPTGRKRTVGPRVWLRNKGISANSHNKRVPEWIFRGSREQVAAFLAAYFNTDGSINRRGAKRKDACAEYYSVSRELLADVQHLLLRVGVQSRLAPKKGSYLGKPHLSWRLTITSRDYVAAFAAAVPALGERARRLKDWALMPQRFRGSLLEDKVAKIEKVGKKPCRCLEIADDHTFTAQDLVVHNSEIISRKFPCWAQGLHPKLRFICSSYAASLAENISSDRLKVLLSREYREVFPDAPRVCVKRCDYIENAADGFMLAAGVDQGITGRSSDIGLIDDPIAGYRQAVSESTRGKLKNWYRTDFYSRLQEGAGVLIMQCMTGDTRVLRSDGSETLLRDIRPGDGVATYRDGALSTSQVVNWVNHGPDRIYEIRTSSGIIVKANERHPFLVCVGEELQWLRLRDLHPGHEICQVNGASGRVRRVLGMAVTSQSQPVATANSPQKLSRLTCDFTLDRIEEIRSAGSEDVFDIEVAETENFIANGLVSHNTRWHEDDLIGWLLEEAKADGEEFQVYNFQAIADEDEEFRKAGDPLTVERFGLDALAAIKRVQGSYAWSALYQGAPAPAEGLMLRRDWWHYYTGPLPAFELKVVSLDCAFKANPDSDHVALQVWGFVGPRGYLLDRTCERMGYVATKAEATRLCLEHKADTLLIEDAANGAAVIEELSRNLGGRVTVIGISPLGGKVARAWPFSADLEAGNAWLPEGVEFSGEIVDYAAKFPNTAMDHDIDAMTQAFMWRRQQMHGLFAFYEAEANKLKAKGVPAKEAPSEGTLICPDCQSTAVRETDANTKEKRCNECGVVFGQIDPESVDYYKGGSRGELLKER
jgi:predicted phage terminase large subunit-like protein